MMSCLEFVKNLLNGSAEACCLFANVPDNEDYAVTTQIVLILKFDDKGQLITVERDAMPNRN